MSTSTALISFQIVKALTYLYPTMSIIRYNNTVHTSTNSGDFRFSRGTPDFVIRLTRYVYRLSKELNICYT